MKSPLVHLIIAIAICAAALGAYGWWYADISAKSAVVADLETQIAEKSGDMNQLTATRSALGEITDDEALVQGYFVSGSSVVNFIENIEALGSAQSATVNVLSVSAGGSAARPTLAFSISVKGTFDAVMRTVGAIEYAPYAISMSSLSVGEDGKDSWHADLSLIVGSLPAKTTATSTP
ncbi:MAG: hypothetical protein WAN50_01210 [Minisyncoccia bacterium]